MATLPPPKSEIQKLIDSNESKLITADTLVEDIKKISADRVTTLWEQVNTPTNNPLMLLQKEKELIPFHEVYFHKKLNGEIVYVGNGIPGRCNDALARRNPDHAKWMLDQLLSNHNFAVVITTGLTKVEARELELTWIKRHKPVFNIQGKVDASSMD